MNYKVSIIIPTYKRSDYLIRAIESVISQNYQNIEIIVIDDNNPYSEFRKATEIKMQKYSNNEKVKYLKNDRNLGGALARNVGIREATGDYITFLDDDDVYLPYKIEKQLNFMLSQDCDMSFTDLKLVNDNKVVVDYREYTNLDNSNKESLLKYHIMRHLTGTPTFMYKADKLKEIGGFEDAKVGQEFYLMLKSIEKGLKISYLNECDVIAYRHKDGGVSQGKNKIIGENVLYDFKKKYFKFFTTREKMFVRFRHYAVMTIAYKRNKEYFKSFWSLIVMFLASPIDCIKEVSRYIINIFKKRRMEIK
jgi:glycosyltransferase involved in cell wall biosynthesis